MVRCVEVPCVFSLWRINKRNSFRYIWYAYPEVLIGNSMLVPVGYYVLQCTMRLMNTEAITTISAYFESCARLSVDVVFRFEVFAGQERPSLIHAQR